MNTKWYRCSNGNTFSNRSFLCLSKVIMDSFMPLCFSTKSISNQTSEEEIYRYSTKDKKCIDLLFHSKYRNDCFQ